MCVRTDRPVKQTNKQIYQSTFIIYFQGKLHFTGINLLPILYLHTYLNRVAQYEIIRNGCNVATTHEVDLAN